MSSVDISLKVQQHPALCSLCPDFNGQVRIINSSTVQSNPVCFPVVSATSSTSCGRQSWRCRVTSRRPSCSGRRLTFIRLSLWSSAWETQNPYCPTPLTLMRRWWSCPAPGSCPNTPTLSLSSLPSSPSPPRCIDILWQNILWLLSVGSCIYLYSSVFLCCFCFQRHFLFNS